MPSCRDFSKLSDGSRIIVIGSTEHKLWPVKLLVNFSIESISLPAAQNVSLTLVICDEWTDLCTRVGILTYPTALFFTPHTLHTPTPLTSLDTPHILNALGLYPLDSDNQNQLVRTYVYK